MAAPSQIAHYQITSKLGEGGMGAVYRATDTKLGRDVAIKILPEAFAQDAERMARFEREARVLASLNHPNIAAIYGVEERALVMELAPGPTLAERIAAGPLPVEEALAVGKQIAEALEYAHEKGIVHRDLKPANVKVTPDGHVKVLDFGLAKALSNEANVGDPMSSPTMTMRATMAGTIMGTAAYMSPEQAKGKPVDRRADIWAFGVVLLEMLTGRQLYSGETVSETLASVIKDTPDLTRLPEATPPTIRRMLGRCLEKDPRRRLRDIGEARFVLEEPEGEGQFAGQGLSPATLRHRVIPWLLAAAFGLVALAVLALWWRDTRPVLHPLLRFSADLGPEALVGNFATVAIAPDGTRIAYPVRTSSGIQLATRLMEQSRATVLAGTESAEQPFFNPDGQWIGFFAEGKLKKISVQGGAAVTLCDAATFRGASWGEDDNIIANLDLAHLVRVPAAGGTAQIIATPEEKGAISYRYPQILPGGQAVLLTEGASGAFDDAAIAVLSLKTGEVKVVQRGGYFGRYLPSGHLIYLHEGTLFGVPFDLKRMATRGAPAPVLQEVASNPGPGTAQLDVSGVPSASGTLVYLSGRVGSGLEMVWTDAAGKKTPLVTGPALLTPRVSPDGKRLAISMRRDISVYDPQRDTMTRITFTSAGNTNPIWTPDGKHIVYAATDGIWWTRADGSGQPLRILETRSGGAGSKAPGSFSPDGHRLVFYQTGERTAQDIWILPLDTTDSDHPKPGKPELFVQTPLSDLDPVFSPDGRWLAYTSAEAGALHVYVRPYPAGMSGGKWQITTTPGRFPIWAPNGRELFYETADGRIMVVEYTAKGETFTPGKPRQWGGVQVASTGPYQNLDLAPDGKRFVVIPLGETGGAEKSSVHAVFLVNFFDDLRRRMP